MFQTIDDIIKHYSKEDNHLKTVDLNQVSSCCHRPIIPIRKMEFPLGGKTWGQTFIVEICECCGKDASPVDQCGICGVTGCNNECEKGARE